MGSVEGTFESKLMTASEIASHLLANCASLRHFEAYIFGSTLHGVGEDIDILAVGPSGETLSKLKQEMRTASEFLPLHVLYMQPSEEQRTEFTTREKCINIKELVALQIPFAQMR
jgi:hypothetical protein